MKKCRLIGVLLWVMLFVAGCGCSGGDIVSQKETKRKESTGDSWTVMIYMLESGMEEKYGRISEVLGSLSYDLPQNINVVVEVGGCKNGWNTEGIKPDKIQDYAVQKNGIRLISEKGLENMGKSDTYSSFISRTVKKYPADRYVSVIWGDGGGLINGAGRDVLYNNDPLTPDEIATALKKTETKLDIIGFDSGFMSNMETASLLAPYADYMIASQDIMPYNGWDYRGLFKTISETPSLTPETVGQAVCDGVKEKVSADQELFLSMSLIDLSAMKLVDSEFDGIAGSMVSLCEDIGKLRAMTALINSAPSFGANSVYEGYSNLVDLDAFMNAVITASQNGDSDITSAIDRAVIYKVNGEFYESSCGMSVYYPKNRLPQEINGYKKICKSEKYKEYLDKSTASMSITRRTADYRETEAWKRYSELSDTYMNAEPDLRGGYMLSASNDNTFINIGVNLYKYSEEDGLYMRLHTDNDVYYSNITNMYENTLKNSQLKMNGIAVESYLVTSWGDMSIYSIPVIYDERTTNLRVLCEKDEDKCTYKVLGIFDGTSDRKYKIPSSGDTITPIYSIYGGTENQYIEGKELNLVFGGLNIKEKDLDDGEYLISYITEDLYGKKAESKTTNVKAIKGKMQISK